MRYQLQGQQKPATFSWAGTDEDGSRTLGNWARQIRWSNYSGRIKKKISNEPVVAEKASLVEIPPAQETTKPEKVATPTLPKLPALSKSPETSKLPETPKLPDTQKAPETPKITLPDSGKAKSTLQIPKFEALKGGPKEEQKPVSKLEEKEDKPFTADDLRATWKQYAETRKIYQAEYYLLSQEVEIRSNQVVVHLHNSFQETLINTIKADALSFLREKLENNSIQLIGELTAIDDSKKVIYTNKEKFDHLAEKNPKLKELKERLGLDTEF